MLEIKKNNFQAFLNFSTKKMKFYRYFGELVTTIELFIYVVQCQDNLASISIINKNETIPSKMLNLSVYYEAKCPNSRDFFRDHLVPNYRLLGQYLKLDLVPFGKAHLEKRKVPNSIRNFAPNFGLEFKCQHGADECWANRIQSCVIGLKGESIGLDYVNCMFQADDYFWKIRQNAQTCATKFELD